MRLSISMPIQNGKASLTIAVIESEAKKKKKKRENCISTESLCVTSRLHYESRQWEEMEFPRPRHIRF